MHQKKDVIRESRLKVPSNNRADNKIGVVVSYIKRKQVILGFPQLSIALTAVVLLGISNVWESSAATGSMLMHNHVTLNVTIAGKPVVVPASVGIMQTGIFADPSLFSDHGLDKYGMEGMSPLHTHDYSGVIHIESNTVRNYTLGEFLKIWKGLEIDGKNVIASVDGKPVLDIRNIPLNDGEKIVLDITP